MEKGTKIFLGVSSTIAGLIGLGYLITRGEGPECETDADCDPGYVCDNGVCVLETPGIGEVVGTVTDCDTGTAISGVTVTIDAEVSTTTNGNGEFGFTNVGVGQHTICYEHADYRSECHVVAVREGQTADASECLEPGAPPETGAIHFKVVECSEIPYVPFPYVQCYADSDACTTDNDGVCVIEGLEPGIYACTCQVPEGYEPYVELPQEVQVVAGTTVPMLIMLIPV